VQGGVALAELASLQLRARSGGERFQRAPRSTPRSLKKCFQEAGVASWQRDGPLLFAGERLVFVPGLGVDARVWAPAGVPQLALRWLPDANAKA
jgi:tRNA(Ile)-lysidine synthase